MPGCNGRASDHWRTSGCLLRKECRLHALIVVSECLRSILKSLLFLGEHAPRPFYNALCYTHTQPHTTFPGFPSSISMATTHTVSLFEAPSALAAMEQVLHGGSSFPARVWLHETRSKAHNKKERALLLYGNRASYHTYLAKPYGRA